MAQPVQCEFVSAVFGSLGFAVLYSGLLLIPVWVMVDVGCHSWRCMADICGWKDKEEALLQDGSLTGGLGAKSSLITPDHDNFQSFKFVRKPQWTPVTPVCQLAQAY
jgi:hypothetical protein